MNANYLICGAAAALLSAAARSAAAGGAERVQVTGATNISTKIVVSTVGADGGAPIVRVFDGSGRLTAADGADPLATWLGVTTESASDEVREQLSLDPGVGLTVYGVMPESPAAKAGLQTHDILTRFNDQILMAPEQLRNLVRAKQAGDRVSLAYLRKGKEATVEAALESRPESADTGAQVIDLGDFTIDVRKFMSQLPKDGGNACDMQAFMNQLPKDGWNALSVATNFTFSASGGGACGDVIIFGGGGNSLNLRDMLKDVELDADTRSKIEAALRSALKQAGEPEANQSDKEVRK